MITVVGLGFVGLTTALGFSKKQKKVFGLEINGEKLTMLRQGVIPFFEPELENVLHESLDNTLTLTDDIKMAVESSSLIFICVGTPAREDGHADLSIIFKALRSIIQYCDGDPKTIVIKSTIPPGTLLNEIAPFIDRIARNKNIRLASNPEFLREGFAWQDFMNPDRIVVGTADEAVATQLTELYQDFDAPVHVVNINTAEFIKYLSNTLLSTLISFANEMSMIGAHIGDVQIQKAFKILHEDKRWSGSPASMTSYVYPGCGYGGYCLPKDTAALYATAQRTGYQPLMLQATMETNKRIMDFVVNSVAQDHSRSVRIGILGLAFKAGSDDVRLTPSKFIIERLLERGFTSIHAYDPIANEAFSEAYNFPIHYEGSLNALINNSDILVLLTSWPEFKLNADQLLSKRLYDFRYVFEEEKIVNYELL